MTLSLFPETARGTYILIAHLPTPSTLTIGRLGSFPFAAGWYAYVGSAFGAGGLRGRLKHHLGQPSHPHWHMDYLGQAASMVEIWYLASQVSYEHRWASLLITLPHAVMPVPRFGASDCRCPAHLFYFPAQPEFSAFQALTTTHGSVQCWHVPQATPAHNRAL